MYKLNCDVDSDPPTVSLGERMIQHSSIAKHVGVFNINNDIFINLQGCVYKPNTKIGPELDLSLLMDKNTESNYPFVYFTFDKR